MEAKKRHSALAEAMAPFRAWRSPKETMSATEYCRRRRSVAHCALSSSIFAARRSDVRRAIPACVLDSSSDIDTPCFGLRIGVLPQPFDREGCWLFALQQDASLGSQSFQENVLYAVS